MQLKPITAIIVLLILVASLAVAGCTIEPKVEVGSPQYEKVGYVSTDYPTSGRSQLVAACVKDQKRQAETLNRTFSEVWYNNTKAAVTVIGKSSAGNDVTFSYTYIHFPTVKAASAYFDSQRGIYEYRPDEINGPVYYYSLTGHNPTVYKQLRDMSRELAEITQYDALVVESNTVFQTPVNQA
jgi:hypothetical protein